METTDTKETEMEDLALMVSIAGFLIGLTAAVYAVGELVGFLWSVYRRRGG